MNSNELNILNQILKYINENNIQDYYDFKRYIIENHSEISHLLKNKDFWLNIYICIKSNRILGKRKEYIE